MGIPARHDWDNPEVRDEFARLWNAGDRTAKIAAHFDVSIPTVYLRVRTYGLPPRSSYGRPRTRSRGPLPMALPRTVPQAVSLILDELSNLDSPSMARAIKIASAIVASEEAAETRSQPSHALACGCDPGILNGKTGKICAGHLRLLDMGAESERDACARLFEKRRGMIGTEAIVALIRARDAEPSTD